MWISMTEQEHNRMDDLQEGTELDFTNDFNCPNYIFVKNS